MLLLGLADTALALRAPRPALALDPPRTADVGQPFAIALTGTGRAEVALALDPRLELTGRDRLPAGEPFTAPRAPSRPRPRRPRGVAARRPARPRRAHRRDRARPRHPRHPGPDAGPRARPRAVSAATSTIGMQPRQETGAGAEFQALKPFAPGMDKRLIDWKTVRPPRRPDRARDPHRARQSGGARGRLRPHDVRARRRPGARRSRQRRRPAARLRRAPARRPGDAVRLRQPPRASPAPRSPASAPFRACASSPGGWTTPRKRATLRWRYPRSASGSTAGR